MEQVLAEIRKLQGAVEAGFGALDKRMDSLETRMDSLEKRMDSLEKRVDSLERRVTTLAEQLVGFGKLLDMLIDEQRRLADRLSEMMKATTQARTEDVARFLAFEERLLALELKN